MNFKNTVSLVHTINYYTTLGVFRERFPKFKMVPAALREFDRMGTIVKQLEIKMIIHCFKSVIFALQLHPIR